ncbi:MAG: LysR family transcriptional regulator [Megasphaera sp.]|uniref:LysR family transcriptional regulator n=1 Tax=Megasphaera sueciensis TaxID=349094 RepID=UPI002ACB0F69|nr:LysR family transcriptional regulator [Megasphaera sp.]MCI1822623.1 LysR family transcriptional regulator [Megasphaera sp.]
MDDRDWQILYILYKEKNITKTAQLLYISQPALTARLKHIEQCFNVTVVNRGHKGVTFTTEGEYLARVAESMMQQMRHIREEVSNLDTSMRGVLFIGASSYFTMFTMPQVLKKFKELYPNIDFNVTTTWSQDVSKLLDNQQIHIGFVSADYGACSTREVLYEEPICIASSHVFQLEDIPFLPRIDYDTDGMIKLRIDKWWRQHFNNPPLVSMKVDRLATCREMIKAGLGYGIVPSRIVRGLDEIYTYKLQDEQGQDLIRKTWLLYHPEVVNLRIAKVFIDFVKKFEF